jgi:single-stranded-DNA-specific exonuclease
MIDENRILVYHGCKQLNKSEKPGINALLKASRTKYVDSTNIGFTLGPRINAVGRLEDPTMALDLMLTDNELVSDAIAQQLEKLNLKRQTVQATALQEAIEIVNDQFDTKKDKCIVLAHENWPPGIVGLISGRLSEKYSVPSLVGNIKNNGYVKGSCRSAQGIDILKCLKSDKCIELFKQKSDGTPILGGHAFAAGFEVHKDNIDLLRKNLSRYIGSNYIDLTFGEQVYSYDTNILVSDINSRVINDIMKISPFGADNRTPIFLVKNIVISEISTVSAGKHLKIKFESSISGYNNKIFTALWWSKGEMINDLSPGDKMNALVEIDLSNFDERFPTVFITDARIIRQSEINDKTKK